MENASRAFLDAVRKPMRQIRTVIGAATINPDLLTAAEGIQYEGYLRREDTSAAILSHSKAGATIKEIVRRTGYSRGLVRRFLRGQRSDVFRVRESLLDLYLPWLDAQWAARQRAGRNARSNLGHGGLGRDRRFSRHMFRRQAKTDDRRHHGHRSACAGDVQTLDRPKCLAEEITGRSDG